MIPETISDQFSEDLHQRTMYVRRCIRYHMHRESYYAKFNKVNSFLGVVFGSTAIAGLLKGSELLTLAAAALVTIVSASDLVIGTSSRISLHSDLRKRFLLIEMTLLAPDITAEQLQRAYIECRKIEADEPPGLPFLNEMAANEVIRATYSAESADEYVTPLPWWKRVTANFIDWDVQPHLVAKKS